ncbi:MAG: DUF3253 domain-containing protein [Rhodospirillaceae bacterium]
MTTSPSPTPERLASLITELCEARGVGKTICPSEVARAAVRQEDGTDGTWRPLMGAVRREAVRLAKDQRIAIYRKGKPLADPEGVKGVIRLGLPPT